MTRARDLADTQDNAGGAVPPFTAGKNAIINGDFGIWQRGTTVNLTASTTTFLADRWACYMDSNAGTVTYSQQTFTPGTAPVAGYEGTYFGRLSTGGNGNFSMFAQRIEDVRTFAGQTVTLSFWAKSSTAKTFTILARQDFGSGGSSVVDQTTTYTTSTSWQRFTWTFTLGSMSGKTIGTNSSVLLQLVAYGSQTGNFTVDIWGVQVEAGSVATPFQTATGTKQGELAACQRYYWRATAQGAYSYFGWALATGTTGAACIISLPVTLRTTPSSVDYSTLSLYSGSTNYPITALSIDWPANNQVGLAATVASGLTQNSMYRLLANNSSSAYIGVSAEL